MPVIGVLALQGDVREHVRALDESGATAKPVRRLSEIEAVDGLVIPGGESTTLWKLATAFELLDPIRKLIADGLPAFGSCAGLIMLADRLRDGTAGQQTFGGIDMTARRNAFGRQVDSFERAVTLRLSGPEPAPQAPSRALPGEGDMGEGLPHGLGGRRGDHSPGGSTAQALSRALPGEGDMGEGLPHGLGGRRGDHSPGGSTAQALSRALPGEGDMGEGLPHGLGGRRGDHSPGGSTAQALSRALPGEGDMGEGLPHWGVSGGLGPPVENTAPFHAVFIRAPWVESAGAEVSVLGEDNGRIIAVRQGPLLATAFHPELTPDRRIHELFVKMVKGTS